MTDDELAPAEEWRDAVLDAMVCCEMWPQKGESAKSALHRLLVWEQAVALDPAVSSDAAALVEQGRQDAQNARTASGYVERVKARGGMRPVWHDVGIFLLMATLMILGLWFGAEVYLAVRGIVGRH